MLASSLGLDSLAFGRFVQFALRCPFFPQRKHIGAGRFPCPAPAGRSSRACASFGGGGCPLPLDLLFLEPKGLAFARALAFGLVLPLPDQFCHKRACGPTSAGTTTR